MNDRGHLLKHELAAELTKARIELHRMGVENRALKEKFSRLPPSLELMFFAFGIGMVTAMIIFSMMLK